MQRIVLCGSIVLLSSVLLSSAQGASAWVQASAHDIECGNIGCGGQHDEQLGMTTASVTFTHPNPGGGSGSAFATIASTPGGGLSLKTFATATAGEVNSNRADATAHWEDVIHTTGTFLDLLIDLRFKITGSKSGSAMMHADFMACVDGRCGQRTEAESPGEVTLTTPYLIDPSQRLEFFMNFNVSAEGLAIIGPPTSTANFGHSLELISITPRDSFGNIVSGVALVSESGFDYNALIVPEPGALTLCTFVLAAFAARRHRSEPKLTRDATMSRVFDTAVLSVKLVVSTLEAIVINTVSLPGAGRSTE